MANLIPKLSADNEVIGETTITEAKENDWPRRLARVFILTPDHTHLLLQQRSATVVAPNLWDMCGGHVDVGESYETAALREVAEELGVDVKLTPLTDGPVQEKDTFSMIFTGTLAKDTTFTLDEAEVAATRWAALTELEEQVVQTPDDFTWWFISSWRLCKNNFK